MMIEEGLGSTSWWPTAVKLYAGSSRMQGSRPHRCRVRSQRCGSLFTEMADTVVMLEGEIIKTYLDQNQIIQAALTTGATAFTLASASSPNGPSLPRPLVRA